MYLKPNPNRKVLLRDPRSMVALPSYGANCSDSSYWIRRVKDGDAVPTTKEDVMAGAAKANSVGANAADVHSTKSPKAKHGKTTLKS